MLPAFPSHHLLNSALICFVFLSVHSVASRKKMPHCSFCKDRIPISYPKENKLTSKAIYCVFCFAVTLTSIDIGIDYYVHVNGLGAVSSSGRGLF